MKPRMTLGWTQYLVVIFGLCTVAFVVDFLCGEPYTGLAEEIARVASLEYQQEFGFEIGPVPIPAEFGVHPWPGIARVTPGGRFDRADIRAGDFVFTQHGGQFQELQWALRSAAAGETACLELQNVEEWRARHFAARMACIGPAVPCQRSGEWDRVLALAARPLVESREALQRAAADRTTDAGRLAAFVLKAAEQRHLQTFTQATPRLLSPIVFSHEELQLALDTPTIARLVVARADVDARGCVARVSLRDLASTEALGPLVVARIQRAIFVPAKPEAQFIGGAMDISLFVDVR